MLIECKSNDGFEDQLTVARCYTVNCVGNGGADYQIRNDAGELRWYGCDKFDLLAPFWPAPCADMSTAVISEP